MVNRLRGRLRGGNNKTFLMMDSEEISSVVAAVRSGLKWKAYEDAVIIAAGGEADVTKDTELAAQLGRTPEAVRARRAKLKKMGKL